jgi:hypothetical protein
MATINVPVGPPYGTIPVNTNAVCAVIPDPVSPSAASDLLIDSAGGRSISALVQIGDMGKMLGSDFVEFTAADQTRSTCFVNRIAWVSIVPHPQIAAVSQINFANRRPLAVAGSVKDVLARLERGPPARSARRAPAR